MLDTPLGKEIYRKGELSGEKRGIQRGAQHVLVKLASQKFGYMPADLKKRVAAITSTQELDQLAIALLQMQSLAEFRQTLNRLQK